MVRVGPAYSFDIEGINSTATLAADLQHIFPESKSYLNSGGEVVFDRFVAARAGYQFGTEGRGLSTGLGVRYGILALDYAYSPLSSNLGNAHTISVTLSF